MKESKRFETTLDQVEARLQSLIEGSISRFFSASQPDANVAHLLVHAMWEGISHSSDGVLLAPNLYLLQVEPSLADYFSANQALLDDLANTLQTAAQESGLVFSNQPVVRVMPVIGIPDGEIRITASNSQDNLAETHAMPHEPKPEQIDRSDTIDSLIPAGAFLIVDGTRVFSLTQTLINIGRRQDSHLVIDDPRVSRQHAQLRSIQGRFVIFDLNSTGGTLVNGQPAHQYTLSPGDVISLSGVPLVYGQEEFRPDETQKVNLPAADNRQQHTD